MSSPFPGTPISGLPVAVNLDGTEEMAIVQNDTTKRATVRQIGQNAASTIGIFNATTAGLVPASGGGTTNFLRADGTFTTTPGGSGLTPINASSVLANPTGATALPIAVGLVPNNLSFSGSSFGLTQSVVIASSLVVGAAFSVGVTGFITGNNFDATHQGLVPASGGTAGFFLQANGIFTTVAAGTGSGLTAIDPFSVLANPTSATALPISVGLKANNLTFASGTLGLTDAITVVTSLTVPTATVTTLNATTVNATTVNASAVIATTGTFVTLNATTANFTTVNASTLNVSSVANITAIVNIVGTTNITGRFGVVGTSTLTGAVNILGTTIITANLFGLAGTALVTSGLFTIVGTAAISVVNASTLNATTINATTGNFSSVISTVAAFSTLNATTASFSTVVAFTANFTTLSATTANFSTMNASVANVTTLNVTTANISTLNVSAIVATTITVTTINATTGNFTTVNASTLNVSSVANITAIVNIVGTTNVTGRFNLVGTSTITGVVAVVGSASFSGGTFGVLATTNITGIVSVVGTANFTGGTFGVTATSLFTGIFGVSGTSTITGTFNNIGTANFSGGAFNVTSIVNVIGTTNITGFLTNVGSAIFTGGTFGVNATAAFTGIFGVVGTSTFTGTYNVVGTSNFSGGAFNVTSIVSVVGTANFTGGTFGVNATAAFTGVFGVVGTSLFTSGAFGVVGTSTFTGSFNSIGTANFSGGAFNVTSIVSVVGTANFTGGTFGVTATSNFTGVFNVNGTATFTSGAFRVIGTSLFTGLFGVVGTSQFTGTFNILGTTTVTGVVGLIGTTNVTGLFSINGSTIGPVVLSDTAPSSPFVGELWWDSATGVLYIYYNDGNSSQWVVVLAGIPTVRELLTADRTYYVGHVISTASISINSPATATLTSHGLVTSSRVIFSVLRTEVAVLMNNASPLIVTHTSHGYAAGQPVFFTSSGRLSTNVADGTTYYVLAAGLNATSYEISATPGGAAINGTPLTNGFTLGTSSINITSHALVTGQIVQFTGSNVAGFSNATDYYVVSVPDANNFAVSTTGAGGQIVAGIVTAQGTTGNSGSHYVRPTGTMPTGVTESQAYYVLSVTDANHFTFSATDGGAAINATVAATGSPVYVALTGSDSNSGLTDTTAGAKLTFAGAYADVTNLIDLGGFSVTISMANALWKQQCSLNKAWSGFGSLLLGFNGGSLTVDSNNAINITVPLPAPMFIDGVTIITTSSGILLNVEAYASIKIGSGVNFGSSAGNQFRLAAGMCEFQSDLRISGGAGDNFIQLTPMTQISFNSKIVTITGVPSYGSYFIRCTDADISAFGDTFTGGATGTKYYVQKNGVITVNGAGEDYFPGNTNGIVETGGLYG